ncbi:hypothetical protein OEZ86_001051 [Tetradesmus obliquus]|nr:hypothetical protein OEZ86_001051 [Tetradesmus obliquus]
MKRQASPQLMDCKRTKVQGEAFTWPSIAAQAESLPFWGTSGQQGAPVQREACQELSDIDISLGLWEKQQDSRQQELSLRCYGSPDCCDDQDTDDTATSTSSTSTDSLQQESALQLQDRASSGRQLAGEDDSINSTSPHRTASAAFSFGCLAAASDDSPVLSFGWPVAAAAAEVAAQ